MITPALCLPVMFTLYIIFEDIILISIVTFISAFNMGIVSAWVYGFLKKACCKIHFKEAAAWASTTSGVTAIMAGLITIIYKVDPYDNYITSNPENMILSFIR